MPETLAKVGSPPIQHPHVLRWYNQVTFESGEKDTSKVVAVTTATASMTITPSSGHSKKVDHQILPKSDVQRDGKTGQMKGIYFWTMYGFFILYFRGSYLCSA